MALTLIATAGAVDANSYCTVAESDTYHEAHVYGTTWIEDTDTEVKEQALVWATRLLDEQMSWVGQIVSDDQALRWPRYYAYDPDSVELASDAVPQFLKDATAEYARLLVASDRTAEPDTLSYKEIKLGSLGLKFDKFDRRPVLPPSVFSIIKWYGRRSTVGQPRILERM
jgi:hypothetical protein